MQVFYEGEFTDELPQDGDVYVYRKSESYFWIHIYNGCEAFIVENDWIYHDLGIPDAVNTSYSILLVEYLNCNFDGIRKFDKDALSNLVDIIEKTYHIYAGTCESLIKLFGGIPNTKSANN